ncbi:type II secretion system F family protein [Microbacterium sp. No. 7]|uniref:type II secretion system F family protein n=1 Tax=Microbacterium sp. No. 7 TaxID=1714373 RepID=UPI0006D27C28|nr:type II secretion system F family protein [Microbacterium sp. No. 7]ALJ20005.1 type II secretion protein F [Microbacterium sp. No. 7]
MTVLWGVVLAAGLLLTLSPWLWPPRPVAVRPERAGPIGRLLEESGYAHAPVGRVPAIGALLGALAGAAAWLATSLAVVAMLALLAGAAAPVVWLRARARRLRRSRRALWADVCDLLISSVRAGSSLPDAVSALAANGPPALRPAFAGFASDVAASGHFDSAALRLKAALGDPVADRIVETLRMARQVGGTELTGVLRALSASVRADAAVRAEVDARQSWIRGAAVVGVVAPWIVLLLLSLRPEGVAAYSSPEGVVVVLAGAAASVVAFRVMLWLGRLPEPQRWFS